ncbi:acyl-CoA synthetase/AMP-acid ligase-like protein II [Pyronema omphalodes]|nr:acyl-CoA synthetase/AMP-acid ligase-like protein II [Pyronema omphalodes]
MTLSTSLHRTAVRTIRGPWSKTAKTSERISLWNINPRRGLLTMSRADGSKEPPLLRQTVSSHLTETVKLHGDRTAVVSRHQKHRLTYRALDEESTILAQGLLRQGVRKGDRVAVSLGNNIEFALATYALFKLGAILVPLNPSFNITQVISALTHLDASHLVVSLETNLPRAAPRSNIPLITQLLETNAAPSLRKIITVDNSSGRIDPNSLGASTVIKGLETVKYRDVYDDGRNRINPLQRPGEKLDPEDIVNIQFTSGTTSAPKAACLTHLGILNNGLSIGDRMLLTPEDSVCCPPPLFHCFGAVLGFLACTTHASAIVFPAECFDPVATLKAVQEEQCTALHGVPTMFTAALELLEHPKETAQVEMWGFDKLRTGIAAGSPVPPELMKKLHRVLNLTELTICYGMTETSPVSFMTTTDDPMEKRLDSVGRLLPHVSAKIVNPDPPHEILPIGEKGELAVAGYNLQKGYWNDPAKEAEVMKKDEDGVVWMHTGDEAMMDPEGYIKITGRLKDLIIRGGENIHPLEIENCLLTHPDILEASVVGLKDEKYGEIVGAFIRPIEGKTVDPDDIKSWVRTKLSNHLVPKHVIPMTGHYPKTASGKIQKFRLREMGERWLKENGPEKGKGIGGAKVCG